MENPPSSPQEPDSKKLKMSTTTSDDESRDITADAEKKPRYKRRKVAIFFAYCGVGYQGMQKNPGAKTIEGDLEEALFLSGAVPEPDRGCPKRFDWARSARTDKGVSAVGQVVSGRFYIDPPGLIDRLNANLSPQIRIFGYKRVTASFSAKKFCDRRRYVYLIPVFALDPSAHRDRESVLASVGSGNELVKCLECSERGRKIIGVMGKRGFESKFTSDISSNTLTALSDSELKEENMVSLHNGNDNNKDLLSELVTDADISSNSGAALSHSEVKEENMVSLHNGNGNYNHKDVNSEFVTDADIELEKGSNISHSAVEEETTISSGNGDDTNLILESAVDEQRIEGGNGCPKGSAFCYGDKERERFNRILKLYEGTHNFHNFTTRTKAEDPSAQRYIISFHANTTVTVDGMEFVKCEVVGQSFMLHQIRKLVGVAVAIMRNCAPESLIETALRQDISINVPTAPEVGLYLDECFFTSYNQKWKDTHEEVSMLAYAEEAENFKLKHIYSHIASTEHKEGAVALWLHSLNFRNYPDLQVVNNCGASDMKEAEVQEVVG